MTAPCACARGASRRVASQRDNAPCLLEPSSPGMSGSVRHLAVLSGALLVTPLDLGRGRALLIELMGGFINCGIDGCCCCVTV